MWLFFFAGNELHVCQICAQTWKDDWNKKTYSVFLFVATYVLPVLLVLTAYVRMGCKLCTPSVLTNNQDGKTNKFVHYSAIMSTDANQHNVGGDIILNRDSRLLHCRRRVARTLLILAVVFALCWMPYNVIQLFLDHLNKEQLTKMDETAPYLLPVFCFIVPHNSITT